jgi:deazaflavin-dependent oxidoreductase (nitroreductase family)
MTPVAPHLSPTLRRVLRAPTYLYDVRVGWLLGRRFLRLTHTGRRSGRRYQTMLEVIGEDRRTGEVLVVAGLGRSAQWLRNVQTGNAVEVAIGGLRFRPRHRMLDAQEASAALAEYEDRNRRLAPIIRRVLSSLVGWRYDGSADARLRLVSELPVVGLRPV